MHTFVFEKVGRIVHLNIQINKSVMEDVFRLLDI